MKCQLMFVLLGIATAAGAEGKRESIMFQNPNEQASEITTVPKDRDDEFRKRCADLSRQIDQLKGNPQRRAAAVERYRAECQDR